ncbi:MAG: hypothetical protein MK207_08140 [Saprospiraceae bacterium]|nr:hypothetical protein [Saprospiraceae bacterium]
MKFLILLLFFLVLLINCTNTHPTNENQSVFSLSVEAAELYKIVGEKHDTAMLLMKEIGLGTSRLRIKLNNLEENNPQKDTILNLLLLLKKADDGMMNWMREFKNTDLNEDMYKAMKQEEIMNYLRQEEIKIEKVHLDMLKSIKDASSFLNMH